MAKSSSQLERRAIDAERLVEAMKKAEYMEEYVGEAFEGVISSVVKFGMFVELPNTIEGLIHISSLPEYYHYNERSLSLKGEKSGKIFKVGQSIRIKLVKADKETGTIDFEYLPSDYDVIDRPLKQTDKLSNIIKKAKANKKIKKQNRGKKSKPTRKKQQSLKKLSSPFYKGAVKKSKKKHK